MWDDLSLRAPKKSGGLTRTLSLPQTPTFAAEVTELLLLLFLQVTQIKLSLAPPRLAHVAQRHRRAA
jgi:hypothetical protein